MKAAGNSKAVGKSEATAKSKLVTAGRSKSPTVLVAGNPKPSAVGSSKPPAVSLSQGSTSDTSVENEVRSNLGSPVLPVCRDTSNKFIPVGAVTFFGAVADVHSRLALAVGTVSPSTFALQYYVMSVIFPPIHWLSRLLILLSHLLKPSVNLAEMKASHAPLLIRLTSPLLWFHCVILSLWIHLGITQPTLLTNHPLGFGFLPVAVLSVSPRTSHSP